MSELTLMELLDSRENRVNYQKALLEICGGVLVSFTLNIPGPVKDSPACRNALKEGVAQLKAEIRKLTLHVEESAVFNAMVVRDETRMLKTGPEGYLCVKLAKQPAENDDYLFEDELIVNDYSEIGSGDHDFTEELAMMVKRAAIAVEEGSALGRLFDIDVLTAEGAISRKLLGGKPRTCLLCGDDAKVCARGRKHSMDELLAEVQRILAEAGMTIADLTGEPTGERYVGRRFHAEAEGGLNDGTAEAEGTSEELTLMFGYDLVDDLGPMFDEYTRMLVEGDPAFQAYLDLQNYDEELSHLWDKYGLPEGSLYVMYCGGKAAGCIGMQKIDKDNCEMKRLYVKPEFRGRGIGELLVKQIIHDARRAGYSHMLLDTMPFLQSAIRLYKKHGFYEIESYNNSPMDTSIYMRLDLWG